jgi:hypothetical protein
MTTSATRVYFVTAAVTACVLSLAITKVSSAIAAVPECDGTRPGKSKRCLDFETTCEKNTKPGACTGAIGIYGVKSFPIDTVPSSSTCKTTLASATDEVCGEQWYCDYDPFENTCTKGKRVKDRNGDPVNTYNTLYSEAACKAVGCSR